MNIKMLKSAVAGLVLSISGFANAGLIYSGPGAINVDTNPATTVSFSVLDHGWIQDLNVAVNITGGHMEDFIVSIEHNGFEAQLNPFLTGHRDLFNVIFDDESLNVISAGGNLVGNYQSFEQLSVFDGIDIFGDWTLTILDSYIPDEGNTLVSWSIEVETVPEPSTLAIFALGIMGLAARRFKKQS